MRSRCSTRWRPLGIAPPPLWRDASGTLAAVGARGARRECESRALKAILGIVSLLVVLAIVGALAKRQLAAVGVATASGTTTPDARDLAVPQQARGIEEQA